MTIRCKRLKRNGGYALHFRIGSMEIAIGIALSFPTWTYVKDWQYNVREYRLGPFMFGWHRHEIDNQPSA